MPRARFATNVQGGLNGLLVAVMAAALAWRPDNEGLVFLAGSVAVASTPTVASLVVSRHAQSNAVGPLLAAMSSAVLLTAAISFYSNGAEKGFLPGVVVAAGLAEGTWMVLFVPFALLLLVFPDGHLPGPGWRRVPPALVVVVVIFAVGAALSPRPYQDPWSDLRHPTSMAAYRASQAMLPVFLGLLVACVGSVFWRFRRAEAVQRTQIRWLVLAGAAVPLALLANWTAYLVGGIETDTFSLVIIALAMYVGVPVAVAMAVTRHDAYDVDGAVVTTAVYTIIGAWLLAVFTAVSAVAGLGRRTHFDLSRGGGAYPRRRPLLVSGR